MLITCGGTNYSEKPKTMALKVQGRNALLTSTPRNLGIMIALMIFGCFVYLLATEYISAKKSKGEVLLFRRDRVPDLQSKLDEEANSDIRVNVETLARGKTVPDAPANIQRQTTVVHWDSVNYDIKIKKKPRRILEEVDGWVIPGTLTALMVRSIRLKVMIQGWLMTISRALPGPGRPLCSTY